jgi:hypothetical protein
MQKDEVICGQAQLLAQAAAGRRPVAHFEAGGSIPLGMMIIFSGESPSFRSAYIATRAEVQM